MRVKQRGLDVKGQLSVQDEGQTEGIRGQGSTHCTRLGRNRGGRGQGSTCCTRSGSDREGVEIKGQLTVQG